MKQKDCADDKNQRWTGFEMLKSCVARLSGFAKTVFCMQASFGENWNIEGAITSLTTVQM